MIRELARSYMKLGLEVDVLTKKWPDSLSEVSEYEGVHIYRIKNARTIDDFMDVIAWLKDNMEKIRPDIIHVIGARRPLPLIGLLLKSYLKIPLVLTIAGGDIPDRVDPFPGTVWDESLATVRPVFDFADVITCVSDSVTNDFRYFFPEVKTPTRTLYAGIDMEFIRRIPAEKRRKRFALSLRRLDPTKGVHFLIDAFRTISGEYPDLELVIAGDGSERAALEAQSKRTGLEERISFIGTIGLERGIALLKGAEMTVVPSLSEAGGLVNVEAQASGCPVVATRVGGIPEYVDDGVSGILCKPADTEDLARNMKRILDDKSLRSRLIKGGYVHADKFDWTVIAPQYLALYDSLSVSREDKGLCRDSLFTSLWDKLHL